MGKSLCIWNKTVFGNQNLKPVGAEHELRSLKKLGDNRPLSKSEKERIFFLQSIGISVGGWRISGGRNLVWIGVNWVTEILDFSIYQLVCASLGIRFLRLNMKEGFWLLLKKWKMLAFYYNLFTKLTMPRISMGGSGFKKIYLWQFRIGWTELPI